MRATIGSLQEVAQVYWFERFLAAPRDDEGRVLVPFEIYTWACPRGIHDGYPNLATCTWPA